MSSAGELSRTLQEVQATYQGGNPTKAMSLSEQACAGGLEHPILLTLAAHHNLLYGDPQRAHARASRAGELAPHSPDVMNVLGQSLLRLQRSREALSAFDAGLNLNPDLPALHYGKAQALEGLNELDRIPATLESFLALEPKNTDALAWMGDLAMKRGDATAGRDYALRALELQPANHGARLTLAEADIAEGKFAEAQAQLSIILADAALSPVNRAFAQSLMGDALDGLDRTREAFEFYSKAKAGLRMYYAPAHAGGGSAHRVARLTEYFRAADPAAWAVTKAAGEGGGRTHVFLLGFPRSGTTLLEQILASHPHVEAMEERDAFEAVIRDFLGGDDGLDRLAALDEAGLERYRADYWAFAASFGHRADSKVFIDKMPLNTVLMPVIARLFPDAKILFALRDPRDVVLSCFRRRFGMTRQMYEFTTLDGAAAYYDAVMGLAEIYRAKLGLNLAETRHEDLLENFDGETRRLCDFLGLPWRAEMRNFARRAQENPIHTPSGAQIARGLTRAGEGQWRRYAEALAPVLPRLEKWVARHGYEATP